MVLMVKVVMLLLGINNVSYGEYTSGLFNARNDSGFQNSWYNVTHFYFNLQMLMVIL